MQRAQIRWTLLSLLVVLPLTGACQVRDDDDATAADTLNTTGTMATQPQRPGDTLGLQADTGMQSTGDTRPMRIEVSTADRELYVYRGGERVATHPVAVGSSEWPTPKGEWSIGQVVWNPRWVPPEEEWAEDEEAKEPGDPENPLGRVQLVYNPPNTVHGTNDPSSIGKAVSHGSIRVTNDVAEQLARQVMEAGGAARDESFYQRVKNNRSERVIVEIPNPVAIRVR